MSDEAGPYPATYKRHLPSDWWLRRRGYLMFMLRDFTPVPLTIWLVWLLIDIWMLRGNPAHQPLSSPWFVAFSIFCLPFAILHSITFLNLAGSVLVIIVGDRRVSPRVVAAAHLGLWFALTVAIGALLIWLGTLT